MMMKMIVSSALTLLLVAMFANGYRYDDSIFPDEQTDYRSFQKRSYYSPSCIRCMHNPSDWGSCGSCYGRSGLVPYYGFAKRSMGDDELGADLFEEEDKRSDEAGDVSKRGSFLYCKCCSALKDKYCCNQCPFKPFTEKRNYETSFVDYAGGCRWCNTASFNFYRCLSCSKKRK